MKELNDKDKILNDAIEIIDKWLDYQVFIKRIPGASFGIVHGNKILHVNHFGYADLSTKKKPNDKTQYRIASISKLFTTTAILQLVQDGKISLDDKIQKYLSWFKSKTDKNLNEITIRHLLMHCSGLNREADSDYWTSDKFPNINEIKKTIENNPTAYKILEKWKYSNLGFAILGQVIKEISGVSYEEYIKRNILNKLNLKDTYVDFKKEIEKNLAIGYGRRLPNLERERFKHIETHDFASATGFSSNVNDLCTFLSSQLDSNEILLKEPYKKEMRRVQWIKDENLNWGLGYIIKKINGKTIYWHSGGFPGFMTAVGICSEHNFGVVVLTNAIDSPAESLIDGIFKILLHLLENYEKYKSIKNLVNYEKYLGRYRCRWEDIDIKRINNSLILYNPSSLDIFGQVDILEHKKDNTFIIKEGDGFGCVGENLHFHLNNKGKVESLRVGAARYYPIV